MKKLLIIFLFFNATTSFADTITGLVGWWRFNEGSGATVADSSGNGNIGTLINTPTWTSGHLDGAISLNGSNQYVTIPDAPSLDITSAITVSCWVKKNNTTSIGQAVSKFDSISASVPYEIQFWNDGNIYANIDLSSGFVSSVDSPYTANTWLHVVETYDGSNVKLYINNVLKVTQAHTGTIDTNTKLLYIGSSGGSGPFGGIVDDIRVYKRALTAADVAQLYNTGIIVLRNARVHTMKVQF